MKIKSLSFVLLLVALSYSVQAGYTANHMSTVQWVKIYNNDVIYFKLDSQPATPCPQNYFVLKPDLTPDQRKRYYSMLLTAKISRSVVSVGYDNQNADCYADRPVVHALYIE